MEQASVRIAQVGPYPPTYGGNSTHVLRLSTLCERAGAESYVFDVYTTAETPTSPRGVFRVQGSWVRKLSQIARLRASVNPDLVHMHVSQMRNFLKAGPLLVSIFGGCRKILTIHSGSFPKAFRS